GFFFQAEDGIRDRNVTGVQTCALPILARSSPRFCSSRRGSEGDEIEGGECEAGDRDGAVGAVETFTSGAVVGCWSAAGSSDCASGVTDSTISSMTNMKMSSMKIGRASCRERVYDWGGAV